MATNPILAEINGLSPGAKTALLNAHQASSAPTPAPATPAPAPQLHAPSQTPTPMMGVSSQPPAVDAKGLAAATNGPMPSLGAPSQPSVIAPRGTVQGDSAKLSHDLATGSGISQIHSKIENSSFGQNHPFLGKLAGWGAQIPAMAADIGVSALAPAITANTPGTEYHHLRNLKQDQGQLAQDTANEGRQAEAEKARADIPYEAAQTENLLHPKDQFTPVSTASGIESFSRNTGGATPVKGDSGQPLMPYTKPGPFQHVTVTGPDGKPHFANYQDGKYLDAQGNEIPNAQPYEKSAEQHVAMLGDDGKPTFGNYQNGKWTDAQGRPINNPRPIPPPPNYGELILPTKTATYINPSTNLPTEMQWDEKTKKYDIPLGLSATNAYGHEAAQAGAVERSADSLIQTIQANRDKIGTVGAWIKKNGLNTPIADPALEGIRAQIASFAALNPAMHGARGAQAIQHFEKIIGDVQQNPDATIAGIRGMVQGAAEPILGQVGNQPSGEETRTYQGHTYVKGPQGWHLQQ